MTARLRSNRSSASPLHRTSAPAPSLIGAHMARVNGQEISRSFSTASTDMSVRYCDSGFMVEWKWFFDATMAICSTVVPKVFMWKRAMAA